jgi:hypothetical protein
VSTQSKPKQARKAKPQRKIAAHTVEAQVFKMLDSEGKERASLSVDRGIAMFALCGEDQEPRLLLSVMPNGWARISAPHRLEDGTLDDSFRLIIANGEPEMIMRDAIFKNASVVSPSGFFADEAQQD